MPKPLPITEILEQLLICEPATGRLIWRERPREFFGSEMQYRRWNGAYAGNEAGRITAAGYRSIKVNGDAFQAHRIVWKMTHGSEPREIDHINRNKSDNRIANLRAVSRSQNMRNKGLPVNNTSGHKHVVWLPRLRKWAVQMSVPGKGQRQLAYCATIEEAVAVRDRLYLEMGYHK